MSVQITVHRPPRRQPNRRRVTLAPYEFALLIAHHEKAARTATRAGAHAAAETCMWRATMLRRHVR